MRLYQAFKTLLVCFLLQAAASDAATLKIATISPDGLSWMKKFRASTRQIEELTEGRVKFKIYPGGVQGDDATVLRKMRIGQLHGGVLAAGSLTHFYPDLQIYNLPLQFRSNAEVDYIRQEMDQMIADGLEASSVLTFAFIETGFAYLMSKDPVTSVADLKDLKAWIPDGDPIAAELVKSFGVSPIPLNITDVLAGLQTGLINAVMAPPAVALALQWHNHVSYMTDLPLVYIYSTMVMQEKAFGRVSEGDQAIIRSVLSQVFAEIERDTRVDNERALQAISTVGVQSLPVSDDELAEWQSMADLSVENLIKSGEISEESVLLYLRNLENFRTGSGPG